MAARPCRRVGQAGAWSSTSHRPRRPLRALALARVIVRAVVVGQLLAGLDALDAGDQPHLALLAQQEAIRAAAAVIDEGGAVAVVEAVDVLVAAQLHDRVGASGDAGLRLPVTDHGALVLDDLAAPRYLLTGKQAVASDGRLAHDEAVVGAFDLLHAES